MNTSDPQALSMEKRLSSNQSFNRDLAHLNFYRLGAHHDHSQLPIAFQQMQQQLYNQ